MLSPLDEIDLTRVESAFELVDLLFRFLAGFFSPSARAPLFFLLFDGLPEGVSAGKPELLITGVITGVCAIPGTGWVLPMLANAMPAPGTGAGDKPAGVTAAGSRPSLS